MKKGIRRQEDKMRGCAVGTGIFKRAFLCLRLLSSFRLSITDYRLPSLFFSTLAFQAFTLAEVLITLGVIGIIAAMTIPALIGNSNEKVTVSQLKKSYSTLSQAVTMAVQENGTVDTWNIGNYGDTGKALNILTNLKPYLKITKTCTGAVSNGCNPNNSYTLSNGVYAWNWTNVQYRAELGDGTYLYVLNGTTDCTSTFGSTDTLKQGCGYMYVDINGDKLPNTIGRDIFLFYLMKSSVMPVGSVNDTAFTFSSQCAKESPSFGNGCTAWVLYNENSDYLKCTGLAWGGQMTCS